VVISLTIAGLLSNLTAYLCFNDRCSGKHGLAGYHPTISVKTLKETQRTDPSQWPGLVLSSYTTGLAVEGALLPLRRFPAPIPVSCG